MSTESKSTAKYWIYFFVSFLACLAFFAFLPEWFWVTLPFMGTAFVYAMDWV